jgi:glycosyltransferase involved in cell wall biosynthesis
MKVLQIVQKPQYRGAEVFASQLSQRLCEQGHDVRIACLYHHKATKGLRLRSQDSILAGQENHPFEKIPGFNPFLLHQLFKVITKFKPDVVQVNGARSVKYGAMARHFNRDGRWVLIYRNIGNPQDWVRGWHYRSLYRKLIMPRIDGIVGVSQNTLQSVKHSYRLSIPMTHIPRGIAPETLIPKRTKDVVRREEETPLEAPVILYVGGLTPEKRLDRFFRVVHRVLENIPNLRVWVIGEGFHRTELERQIKKIGLVDTVYLLGVKENVADYMSAADLLLLTSDTEGMPGVILEAGWLGLPVVATRVGGVPECVLEGGTGLLVQPDDEVGLVQAVVQLLQQPETRRQMGRRAREFVQERFTIDKIAPKYLEFYQQVRERRSYHYL